MKSAVTIQKLLFSTSSYRDFISVMIEASPKERGYRKQLADCAGCQPSYFSQMMANKVELTPEQAEGLCQFWGLSALESDCFFHLVQLGRAGTPALRKRLEGKLKEIRAEWKRKTSTFEKPSIEDTRQASQYYSHWLHSAIHVLLTVPGFQTVKELAKHLNQVESRILEVLSDLQKSGLVIHTENRWQTTQAQLHAPHEDFFAEVHHKNWRLQAAEVREANRRSVIRYTSVHTISQADFLRVKDLLQQAINDSRAIIAPSPEETAACLVLDYFSL